MPDIFVDNRPPSLVFDDTNRVSDAGMNFANAMMQAPAAAARIRQQQAQMQLANLWHQQEEDRKDRAEQAQSLWREHEFQLGKAKESRESLGQLGTGAYNAAKLFSGFAGGVAKTAAKADTPAPSYVIADINHRIQTEAQRQGLMRLDPATGKFNPVGDENGQMKPEDANAFNEIRMKTFLDAGVDPQTYKHVGSPTQVPLPSQDEQLREQEPTGARSGTVHAPAEATPEEEAHHAQNIANLYLSGDRDSAQQWIGQMRNEWGDEFTDHVKQRVRDIVAQQPAAPMAQDAVAQDANAR